MPVLMLFPQKALQYPSSSLVSTDRYNCDGATSVTYTAVAAMQSNRKFTLVVNNKQIIILSFKKAFLLQSVFDDFIYLLCIF